MAAPSQGPENDPAWTNKSVLAFSGGEDPVECMVSRARTELLSAIDAGWNPPPYDAFELARWLKIPLEPSPLVVDARTVPDSSSPARVRIQFNPTRPRGRLQFSIAHEIGHTFFPDVADAVRQRTATGALDTFSDEDDWQLELLCNIAAGELLMPAETIADLNPSEGRIDLELLMSRRKELNVSTEALLRRVTALTDEPVNMFASRRRLTSTAVVDYSEASRSSEVRIPRGLWIPHPSVVEDCTAIGFTAVGQESWGSTAGSGLVQAVGVAPFPGESLPRVVGLFSPAVGRGASRQLVEIRGDLLAPRGDPTRNLLLLLTNNKTRGWGGKLGHRFARKFPRHAESYRMWTVSSPDHLSLGAVHFSRGVAGDPVVATLVAQDGIADPRNPGEERLRYPALLQCLEHVARVAGNEGLSVHTTRTGTGEAGGRWPLVRDILDRMLVARGIPVTVYRQPTVSR